MSPQVRHRLTAVLVGFLALGAPLLTTAPAAAQPATIGADRGPCRAEPDVRSLSVPVDSTVRVVNRTGHRAELRVDGTLTGVLPDLGSIEVVVRRPDTAVVLSPICPPGREFDPAPAGTTDAGTLSTSAPDPVPLRSAGQAAPKDKIKTNGGTGDSAPMPAGEPSPVRKRSAHGVPKQGFPPPADPGRAVRAAPTADVAGSGRTARRPISNQGLIGLLAAVAIVCVIGVATGVVRAITSERAFRTKLT